MKRGLKSFYNSTAPHPLVPGTAWSPASRSSTPGDSFAGSHSGGMATPGGTPTPDLPPLGIWSGLPLIPCPECGDAVEEYIPGLGGTITGNPSSCRRNETGVRKSCSLVFVSAYWLCPLPLWLWGATVLYMRIRSAILGFRFLVQCHLEEWLRFLSVYQRSK